MYTNVWEKEQKREKDTKDDDDDDVMTAFVKSKGEKWDKIMWISEDKLVYSQLFLQSRNSYFLPRLLHHACIRENAV